MRISDWSSDVCSSDLTLPDSTVGAAYSQALSASGGTAPYTFAVTAGSLPAGLNLAADGSLTGTPAAGGSFAFTATANDDNGLDGARNYTLTVGPAHIALAPTKLGRASC